MGLPGDGHVHSEWSWDAQGRGGAHAGSMSRTCERAVELGIPALVFTEHVDFLTWSVAGKDLSGLEHIQRLVDEDGVLAPPPLDVDGYLAAIAEVRERFPQLQILTGIEFGQPHRTAAEAAGILAAGRFDRVNGSLHMLPVGDSYHEPPGLFRLWDPATVMREYLAELLRMIQTGRFDVLSHILYPIRYWPADAAPFVLADSEDGLRTALRALAERGRALELNTRDELPSELLRWWREEGGRAVTFGSDAHTPDQLGRGLAEVAVLAREYGFGPGVRPGDPWMLDAAVSMADSIS